MRHIRCSRRWAAALVLVVAAATAAARAEDEFDLRLIRPIVTLSAWGSPDAGFKEGPGEYGAGTFSIGANIPLGSTQIHPGGKVLGHQFMLGAKLSTTSQRVDGLAREPRLYNGMLAATALFASSKGNLYLGSLGASFAEDEDTIDDLDTRLFALGLGTWRKDSELTFVYGAALTYVYGREAVLPAFGIVWRPNETWTVAGTLPFNVRVAQRLSDDLRLNYLVWISGQRYRFANEGTFPGQDAVVFERIRETHVGAEIEYRATTDLTLLGQAGMVGGRRLSFADPGEDDFVDATIDPAPYVKLTLRYAFGKTLVEQIEERIGAAEGSRP